MPISRANTVKHENFVSDITAFSTTLKKAIQDLATGALDLQMGQPTVRYVEEVLIGFSLQLTPSRPDTVTMAVDPVLATGMNLDDFLEVRLPGGCLSDELELTGLSQGWESAVEEGIS